MARRITWSKSSVEDLNELRQYISQHSPENAKNFIRKIRKKAELLAEFPEMGREVPELENATVREIFVSRYRMLYRVGPSGNVEILRVQRGRPLSHDDLENDND